MSFLLTDIEGSTAHWEQAGEAFRPALVLHHEITRRVLAEFGGRELTEAGDGFLIVFAEPVSAARCALALQTALAQAPWPAAVGSVKVRLALHLGPVEPLENGEFRGPTLNRAARLREGAHGGQLIASEHFLQALGDEFARRELGVFRLRGFNSPERISQLGSAETVAEEFPALKLTPAYEANLPTAQTRFFGRIDEISKLREMLSGPARLVTMTGPGGTGKTRLSLAVAEALLGFFSHAVWFVPLADLSVADQMPAAIREALRLPPDPAREALAQVLEFVAEQPGLLVFDNFEQLGQDGAALIQNLLRQAPALRCLITSRQRLGLGGEREYSVRPLAVPPDANDENFAACESVQLFVDRAQAVRSDFALTAANAPAVGELCRKLEGVPLALELAAARAQVVSPREMVQQLGQRLDYFASHDPQGPARHRTLRAAIDWSYDFLPPALQEFFANLSIFRSGWIAEAATEVAAVPGLGQSTPNILHALGELRACSMLLAEDRGDTLRFRMLETLRQYAGEKLAASPSVADVQQRFIQYFIKLADAAMKGLSGSEQKAWFDRYDDEHENVLETLRIAAGTTDALQIASDFAYYWRSRGFVAEGRKLLDELQAITKDPPLKLRAEVHNSAGILATTACDYEAARKHFTSGLEIFRTLGEDRNVAALLANLGCIAFDNRDYATARAAQGEALALFTSLQMEQRRAQLLGMLASTLLELGDPQARVLQEETLAIARRLEDQTTVALALQNLAEIALREERHEETLKCLEEALQIRESLRDQFSIPYTFSSLGCAAIARGSLEEGVRWLAAAEVAVNAFKTGVRAIDAEDADRALMIAQKHLPSDRIAELWREGQLLGEQKIRIFRSRF